MQCVVKLLAFVTFQALIYHIAAASECKGLLQEFYSLNRQQPAAVEPDSLLYVLQTPGTYEPHFYNCFVRMGTKGSKRCPSFSATALEDDSISKLPLQQCKLLSSADDMSVLQALPQPTAVATQLRDPVERIISAYEIAVEVAVQNQRQGSKARNPMEAMKAAHAADVWPYSKLSPFVQRDLVRREQLLEDSAEAEHWVEMQHKDGTTYYINTLTEEEKDVLTEEEELLVLPAADPYNNKLTMPLKDFIAKPATMQHLHNGELFAVLGISNMSRWSKAHDMRRCIRSDTDVADELLAFAKKRLEMFAHVGVADNPHESTQVAASALHLPLSGPAYSPEAELFVPGIVKMRAMKWKGGMKSHQVDSAPEPLDIPPHGATTVEELEKLLPVAEAEEKRLYDIAYDMFMKMDYDVAKLAEARNKVTTAKAAVMQIKHDLEEMQKQTDLDQQLEGSLLAEYHSCSQKLHEAAAKQTAKVMEDVALPDGRKIRFSPEARKRIPQEILARIRRFNALDIKLYEFAKELMQQRQQAAAAAGQLQGLTSVADQSTDAVRTEEL